MNINIFSFISHYYYFLLVFLSIFLENNFKLIASFSNHEYVNENSSIFVNLVLQLKF